MVLGNNKGVIERWPVVRFFVPAIQNHTFREIYVVLECFVPPLCKEVPKRAGNVTGKQHVQ